MVTYEYDSFETALAKERPEGGKRLGGFLDHLREELVILAPVGLVGADDGPRLLTWMHAEGQTRLYELRSDWGPGDDVLAGSDWIGDFHFIHDLEFWIVEATRTWLWIHPRHRWLCELDVDDPTTLDENEFQW